jgi:hypothetical protein
MAFRMGLPVRLAVVPVCLCVLMFSPTDHLAMQSWAESPGEECPGHHDGDHREVELTACSSSQHRLRNWSRHQFSRRREARNRHDRVASSAVDRRAIVGHQLANGLCAPLLL